MVHTVKCGRNVAVNIDLFFNSNEGTLKIIVVRLCDFFEADSGEGENIDVVKYFHSVLGEKDKCCRQIAG